MELTSFEWLIITVVGGILFGVVGYFLKRTMNRVDKQEEAIHSLQLNSVTRPELKEMKNELRGELEKLTNDVAEIKDKVLYKDDFYRVTVQLGEDIKGLQDLIIKQLGGPRNGDY